MKKITLVLAALFALCYTQAQTTLAAGDIAFLGSNTDPGSTTTDNVSFVLLKDIDAATTIIFTDRGWNDTGGFSNFPGDGELTWTSGSARSAGDVIVLDLTIGELSNSGAYSSIGDQLFAIQGSIASPIFIAGIHFNVATSGTDDANWDGSATTNSTSALPNALSTGDTAVRLTGAGGIEQDNFQFSCTAAGGSPITGTAAAIRAVLHNSSNWFSDNFMGFSPPVESGCTISLAVASDTTPPMITCAATPADIPAGVNGMAAIPDLVTGSSATDDVSIPANITITQMPTAGTMVGVGVNMVTVTAMDEAGNTASCMIDVTVLEPPTTSLAAGDIAFVGFNLDGSDSFAFIILEDIIAGTNIKFTDCGVVNPNTITCSSGDSSFTWYAPTAITAGTIITLPGSSFSGPLASQGDQILAYQGTATAPTFLAGIHANVETGTTNDADWDGGVTMLDESALPDQLTNGVNALRVHAAETEVDNWQLNCASMPPGSLTGTKQEIAAVINDLQYWVSNDATEYVPTVNAACIFTVIVDNTPPTLVSTDPGDDATDVAVDAILTATFDEPIVWKPGNAIAIAEVGGPVAFSIFPGSGGSVSGNTITLDPPEDLEPGTEYFVLITGNQLEDIAGNPFPGIPFIDWTFTTAGPPCSVDIDTQPLDKEGCADNSPDSFLVVASGIGTLSYNWQFSTNGVDFINTNDVDSIFNFAYGSSLDGNQYRVIVTSDNGTPGDDTDDCSITSDVVTLMVNPLPTVTFVAPENLDINAGIQTGLGGGTPMQGTESGDMGVYSGPGVTDDGNGMTYSFDPAATGVGTHIITYTYTDENGCSGSETDTLEVTTTGGGDTTPPTFASSVPTDDAMDISLEAVLMATFSEPVQFATGGQIVIQDLTAGTTFGTIDASSGAISFSGNDLIIDPMPPFIAGNEYEIQIPGTALEDAAGNPFAGIASGGWTFTAEMPPMIELFAKKFRDDGVGTVNPVTDPVLPGWEFTLYDDSGNELARGTTDANGLVSFGSFPPGTYTICETPQVGWTNVFGPEDADPEGLSRPCRQTTVPSTSTNRTISFWNFEDDFVDTTPPTSVSTDPADDATGVAVDEVLTATFSEPVQFASGGEIVIQDLTAGTTFGTIDASSGAISFSGNDLMIDPMPPFIAGNEYEIQIPGTALEDAAGNPFAGIPSGGWTFTIAPSLSCPTDLIILKTQQEVDEFATTYDVANCAFEGGIQILGADITVVMGEDITNLDGLSGLTSVGGEFRIQGNPDLTNVDGLSNLTTVGGAVNIAFNSALMNLDGLAALTNVGEEFNVSGNSALMDVDGLLALTEIGGPLLFQSNDSATNLDGLSAVTSVGGDLSILGNVALANCVIAAVCDSMVVAGDTSIGGNTGDCADLEAALLACQPPLTVVGFNLINADTDMVIGPLAEGAIIDVGTLPTMNLNIQAVTTDDVDSMLMELSGTQDQTMTENTAPYALFGNLGPDYNANVFDLGGYSLTATPYSANSLGGTMGTPATISFSFVSAPVDMDGDGFFSDVDCDDDNPAVNPEAEEVCDGIDNNCDGLIDDEDPELTCEGMEGPADLIEATYLMGTSNPSPLGPILRAEEGNRETYMKFDLSGFSGPVTGAELRMTVASDPGNGTLEVFLGSSSNWTETGLNGGNKPTAVGGPIGSISGTHSLGQTKVWNLDVGQLASGGEITLIVKHSNGNDVAFASDETAQAPELIITTGGGGPVDMDGDGFFSDVDCDDDNPAVNPGAIEVCDGIDNNCDGLIDDEDPEVDCDVVTVPADLIDATYLQGSSNPSPQGPILRAEEGNRVTYLKFDLGEGNGDPTAAELRMTVASDPGNGTLEVFLGSDSNWNENDLDGNNAPIVIGPALATITGTHSLGQTKVWNLNVISELPGNGVITLIVKHSNGNDVAFASDETAQAPELIITTEASGPVMQNVLNLFPNPASDEIAIGFEIPTQVGAIFIYDVSGKLVQAVSPSEVKAVGDYRLNVSGMPSGMYFVRTFDERGVPHQKAMVIEN